MQNQFSGTGIAAREAALFDQWRRNRVGFVADGVVDEDAYAVSSPKILFVLKEVNDVGGGGWDLREYLREGGRRRTWDNVTRWLYGIRNLNANFDWKSIQKVDLDRRLSMLRSIAVMNLKKSPGSYICAADTLATVAIEDKTLVEAQFRLYDADLVICCGTEGLFHNLVHFEPAPDWRQTHQGIWYHEHSPGKYIIDYNHPEARVPAHLLYYPLIDAVREIWSAVDGFKRP